MGLEQLTEHVFYLPHEPETDRPMLAYVRGGRFSLAIDAGYSAAHVGAFYRALSCAGMPEPDFTVLTHWHYDHSFGLHCVHGASFAHWRTNDFLRQEREKARCDGYFTALRREDPFYAREYTAQVDPEIVPAGVSFRDGLRFELGGLAADASHIEAPHSEDCVCIYVPEDRVLFLGDATSEDFFHGNYMDQGKLRRLVERIENTDCKYCVLSHAAPLRKSELLEYLESILASRNPDGSLPL